MPADHALQVPIHWALPQRAQRVIHGLLASEAATVPVNQVESLLKLLDLGLVKLWDDIGYRPFRSLFWCPWL